MRKITIDFETRSTVDLRACGMHVYAEDESTDVQCLAVKVGEHKTGIWVPAKYEAIAKKLDCDLITDRQLQCIVDAADTIEAHNSGFERLIWQNVMVNKYGFKKLDETKLRCTAAKAAMHNLPRALDKAGAAMDLTVKKDTVGQSLMLKLCKPKKNKEGETGINWHESPEDLVRLFEYCRTDVDAEYELNSKLADLSEMEQKVFELDSRINDRGVPIDVLSINTLIENIENKEKALLLEFQTITEGFVQSPKQVSNTIKWLQHRGCSIDNLKKYTVEEALDNLTTDDEDVKRVLEIRQALSKTSTAKLQTFLDWCCKDGRVKGMFLYHGASTGRWSSRGPQIQNLPRDSYDPETVDDIVNSSAIMSEMIYGCPLQSASKCIRGMIKAPKGKTLIAADFSAIEARVIAWVAGETKVLEAFRNKKDLYKIAACDIYHVKYDEVTKEQRAIGKVAVLALGYQGWVGAFNAMAGAYGVYVSEEEAKEIVSAWRRGNPSIVKLWSDIENAAIATIKTGKATTVGCIKFGMRNNFLHMRLPSGRLLSYYKPSIEEVTTKFGTTKEAIAFIGEDSITKKIGKIYTYGGKLCENLTQAISRDLLVESMFRLDKAGLDIVMHVHDEVVCEVPKDKATPEFLKAFEATVAITPEWAKGLPLAAEGWISERYKK